MLLSLGFMMTAKADSGFSFLDPEFTLDPEFKNKPEKRPHLVAVLPFLNKTDNTEASTVVRRAIYNHFSSLGYIDTELTIIDAKLKQNYALLDPLPDDLDQRLLAYAKSVRPSAWRRLVMR